MKIKLKIFFFIILSISAISVSAQTDDDEENRRVQISAGYSYQRKSGDETFSRRVFRTGESNRDLNGVNVEGTYYFNRALGITGNFSAHFDKDDVTIPTGTFGSTAARNIRFKEQTYNYMAGPQVRFLNSSRVTPFARVLFGAQTTRTKLENFVGTNNAPRFNRTNFAMAIGGGVDVRVNKKFAVRAIQLDYVPSFERRDRANIFGTGQRYEAERVDQVRIGFGVVFK